MGINSNQKSPRCLYHSSISNFIQSNNARILGEMVSSFHGSSLTTTNESWEEEIRILKEQLKPWEKEDAYIIFEYAIPRLGKRIDVVILLKGIIFMISLIKFASFLGFSLKKIVAPFPSKEV